MCLRIDRSRDAIADYRRSLKQHPKNPEALYGPGLARIAGNERAAGDSRITDAKAINPGIANTFRKYGITPNNSP